MPVKSIALPARTVKFGRKRPVARGLRLSLRNYLTRALPAPPPSSDYRAAASASLSKIYDNDTLGDCVIACMGHVVGILTGNAGAAPFLYTSPQIIALYSAIGGYDPAAHLVPDPGHPGVMINPTDNGCDEQTALNFWENNGAPVGSHEITGWVAVNPADPTEVRTALWLFENLVFGFELPDAWISPFPDGSGFSWDVEGPPDPNNGHCVAGVGYTAAGVVISTWGMTGLITDAGIAKYCSRAANGELYTVISQDGINKATMKAPSGFDWSQLVADFDSMGGGVAPG